MSGLDFRAMLWSYLKLFFGFLKVGLDLPQSHMGFNEELVYVIGLG